MAGDGLARAVEGGEGFEEVGGEFGGDVGFHFVVARPGGAGRVDVEAGAGAEVVGFVLAFDGEASCCWLALIFHFSGILRSHFNSQTGLFGDMT